MSELNISPALGPPAGLRAMPMATFWDALALRARANRAFYVSLGIYALFAIIGLGTGLLHSDILVRSGIFFILVMGLDLLFGLGGMLSFAHIGFFSIAGLYGCGPQRQLRRQHLACGTGGNRPQRADKLRSWPHLLAAIGLLFSFSARSRLA